jgi:MoaA/NifB/PqqE/SkfB family radical SAM enzyme
VLARLLYSPFLAQVIVTRRCNLSCGYCNEYDSTSDPVPLAELMRRADKLKALGTWAIEFSGGEPMLHPEIYELVAYCRAIGFSKVMLLSNGFLFNEEKIRRLNEAGLTDLQVSVDGVSPNDVTVKVLKPLTKKLEMIARTAEFRVTLNGVIGSTASHEVLDVIDFAKRHDFKPRVCLIHGPDGKLDLGKEELELYRRVKDALGERFEESGDYRTKLIEEGVAPFRCRAGSRYLYIDEFGIVRWCSQQRETFGIPLDDYTHDDLRRQFYTHKECAPQCTVGCVRTCSSIDGFRKQDLAPDGSFGTLVPLRRPNHAAS